jgi:hypothetical protein
MIRWLCRYAADKAGGLARALADAQRNILDEGGKTPPAELADLHYWVAFALIGDGSTSDEAATRVAGTR